jgi:hypothetical protein
MKYYLFLIFLVVAIILTSCKPSAKKQVIFQNTTGRTVTSMYQGTGFWHSHLVYQVYENGDTLVMIPHRSFLELEYRPAIK